MHINTVLAKYIDTHITNEEGVPLNDEDNISMSKESLLVLIESCFDHVEEEIRKEILDSMPVPNKYIN